jgi:hypothetical protein
MRLGVPGYLPALVHPLVPWARRHIARVALRYGIGPDDLWDETMAAFAARRRLLGSEGRRLWPPMRAPRCIARVPAPSTSGSIAAAPGSRPCPSRTLASVRSSPHRPRKPTPSLATPPAGPGCSASTPPSPPLGAILTPPPVSAMSHQSRHRRPHVPSTLGWELLTCPAPATTSPNGSVTLPCTRETTNALPDADRSAPLARACSRRLRAPWQHESRATRPGRALARDLGMLLNIFIPNELRGPSSPPSLPRERRVRIEEELA